MFFEAAKNRAVYSFLIMDHATRRSQKEGRGNVCVYGRGNRCIIKGTDPRRGGRPCCVQNGACSGALAATAGGYLPEDFLTKWFLRFNCGVLINAFG